MNVLTTGVFALTGLAPIVIDLKMHCVKHDEYALFAVAGGTTTVLWLLAHSVPCAVAYGVSTVYWVWRWWQGRRRRRVLRLLGHKARAALEALLRNMPTPSHVLRPVPQSAGFAV